MLSRLRPAIAVIVLVLAVFPAAIQTLSEANATHGGNVAIVSIWNEAKKSNVVFDTTLVGATNIIMEVNVTDAVRLKGFDITLRYDINFLDGQGVNIRGIKCPTDEGCLFDGNNHWDLSPTFESVAYDTDNDLRYDSGETVIRSPTPPVGTHMENDPRIKYIDSTSPFNQWNSGEIVVYDSNENNQYSSGEPVISAGTPTVGAVLKTDLKIRFNDNKLATATPLIHIDVTPGVIRLVLSIVDTDYPFTGGTGTLFRANFTASGTRGATMINIDEGASFILDPNPVPYAGIDGFFDDRTSPEFNYSVTPTPNAVTINRPVSGTANSAPITVNVALITGTTRPVNLQVIGLPTSTTASFSVNDASPTFSSTLTITINGGPAGGATTTPSGTYAVVIAGNATVASHLVKVGYLTTFIVVPPPPPTFTVASSPTSLTLAAGLSGTSTITTTLTGGTAEEVTLSADVPAFGNAAFSPNPGTALKTDSKVKYVDGNNNNVWSSGEAVVYDTDNDNSHDSGEPVIAGLPSVNAALKTDSKVKYVDGNNNNVWDPDLGERVVYDTDNDNLYDLGEPVIGNAGLPTFSSTMTLTAGSFTDELVLSFTNAPDQGSALKTDSKLKIIDTDGDGFYDTSDHVVYDTDNDNIYDSGEPDVTLQGAPIGSVLVVDSRVKYFDSNSNNVRDSSPLPGEPVVYDYDSSNTYNKELIAVTPAGTYEFNITATSSGEFSEQSVTVLHEITFSVTNRDVAVTSIAVSRTFAYAGIASQNMVTVGVANQGSITETFTVSIKLGTITIVGSEPVTLAAGGSTSVSLDFLAPASLTPGSYTLSADIFDPHHPSRGRGAPIWDSEAVDNAMTYGTITVRFGGDVTADCVVNVSDLAGVGAAFGSSIGPPPSPNWNPNADLNNDGVVNVSDLAAVGSRFGQSC